MRRRDTLIGRTGWGLLLAAGLVAGCSEPLATAGYRGKALLRLQGKILVDAWTTEVLGFPTDLKVAVFWNGDAALSNPDEATAMAEEVRVQGSFPADVEVTLFQPAPDAVLQSLDDRPGRLGLAVILLYVDVDRDDRWDRHDEAIVGGAPGVALVYATEAVPLATGGALKVGYNLVDASHITMEGSHEPAEPPVDGADDPDADAGLLTGHWLDRVRLDHTPDRIDLLLTEDVFSIIPDLDGDGQWGDWQDPCEPILEEAERTADPEHHEMLMRDFEACEARRPPDMRLPPEAADCSGPLERIAFHEDERARLIETAEYLGCMLDAAARYPDFGLDADACPLLCEAPPPEPIEELAARLAWACGACEFPAPCGHDFVNALEAPHDELRRAALEDYLRCAAAVAERHPEPGPWSLPCESFGDYQPEIVEDHEGWTHVHELIMLCEQLRTGMPR